MWKWCSWCISTYRVAMTSRWDYLIWPSQSERNACQQCRTTHYEDAALFQLHSTERAHNLNLHLIRGWFDDCPGMMIALWQTAVNPPGFRSQMSFESMCAWRQPIMFREWKQSKKWAAKCKSYILSKGNNNGIPIRFISGFSSVVVITLASHARGPRFDPGLNQAYILIHK